MKELVERLEIKLQHVKNETEKLVETKLIPIDVPEKSNTIARQSQPPTQINKLAYGTIGAGILVLLASAVIDENRIITALAGIGGISYGFYKMKNENKPVENDSNDADKLIEEVNSVVQLYNDTYKSVEKSWDNGLSEIKKSITEEINRLSLESDCISKINDIIRSRSVIRIPNLDLLSELRNISRDGDFASLNEHVQKTKKTYMDAIETAYNEQRANYDKLESIKRNS